MLQGIVLEKTSQLEQLTQRGATVISPCKVVLSLSVALSTQLRGMTSGGGILGLDVADAKCFTPGNVDWLKRQVLHS